MVPNFVMKVDYNLQLRPNKVWATWVDFQMNYRSSKLDTAIIYQFLTW